MNTRFKFFIGKLAIIAVMAATAALAGCSKEITPGQTDKIPASEGSRVIAVSFGPRTKTYLDDDGLTPKFADKDSILISNGEALDTCKVSVNGDEATISTDLTGPLTAVYPYTAAKMNGNKPCQIDSVLVSTEQDGTYGTTAATACVSAWFRFSNPYDRDTNQTENQTRGPRPDPAQSAGAGLRV